MKENRKWNFVEKWWNPKSTMEKSIYMYDVMIITLVCISILAWH